MQPDLFQFISQFNNQASDATRELADINQRAFAKLADQQVKLANVYLDGAVRQIELTREAKDTGTYLKQQAELTKDYSEKFVGTVRESLDVLNDTREAYGQWLDKGVKETADQWEKAQDQAVRKTKKAA